PVADGFAPVVGGTRPSSGHGTAAGSGNKRYRRGCEIEANKLHKAGLILQQSAALGRSGRTFSRLGRTPLPAGSRPVRTAPGGGGSQADSEPPQSLRGRQGTVQTSAGYPWSSR